MPSRSAGWSFAGSDECRDANKPWSRQICRRTAARVSEKVGRFLWYQAVAETRKQAWWPTWVPSRVTMENSPSRQGVVRAIAWSDHCRWLSTPRWSRTSRKVTSTCQRCTNQRTICTGSWARSVQSRACGSKRRWGSRSSAQRIGTTGSPAWHQTACPEQISTEPVALAIPAGHGHAPPRRGRVGQHLGQVRRARALGSWSADCSRPAWRRWFVEGGIEAKTGDTDHPMPDKGGQELEGGETAVSHKHQRPLRHPATGLEDQLARPVGQFLVPFAVLAAVPLGGRQGGQEGQRPNPPGPGDRDQHHQAEPTQTAGLDEVAVAGADRVAVDPFGAYAFAAPALDCVVEAEDHRPLWHEGVQQHP